MSTTFEGPSASAASTGGVEAPSGGTAPAGTTTPAAAAPTGPWKLPAHGAALRLVAADFKSAARSLGCETAAVHAVAEVESGGRTGFDTHKRPKILFETHLFRTNSGGKFNSSHPELTAPYGTSLHLASYNKDQWKVMHSAFALDHKAAVKSASWGMFQVIGSNAKSCGWKSLRQFVTDMFYSEGQHMRCFLGFCRANHLTPYLARHDWASFARGYNGSSYRDFAYDTKIAAAYARYKNR
jgi:hypothetical protein